MDLREINTFIHVVNQESFSKAADILGYTQAAVSIQIKQLESELGTRLLTASANISLLPTRERSSTNMPFIYPMRLKK